MSDTPKASGQVIVGRPLRLGRGAALDLLRQIATDRASMLELRQLYAGEVRRSAIHTLRDDVVLEQLAERLASGALTAAVLRRPEPPVPLEGEEESSSLVETAAEVVREEKKPTASLTNPRWSQERVEVGEELEAAFTYSGFVDNKSATVHIYECDNHIPRTKIASIDVTVEEEDGDHTFKWKREPKDAEGDLKEDQAAGDNTPVEYVFEVEAKGTGHSGFSGPLWLTNTVTVNLKNKDDGKEHETPRIVVLSDYKREQRVKSEGGTATFEKVLVGPVEIRLAEPKFSGIGWSASRVPVGEQVEAVFKFEDAMKGMMVSVAVHEFNADGSTNELDPIEVELSGVQGEARVPFTRTEDEAQEDMAQDEREGDTGPLEYRYYVVTEDEEASEVSEPLMLTHTVTIKLENQEDGAGFEDGLELLLIGADGTEHRATLEGGEAKFENVVCGPMTVKLAPPGEGEDAP